MDLFSPCNRRLPASRICEHIHQDMYVVTHNLMTTCNAEFSNTNSQVGVTEGNNQDSLIYAGELIMTSWDSCN